MTRIGKIRQQIAHLEDTLDEAIVESEPAIVHTATVHFIARDGRNASDPIDVDLRQMPGQTYQALIDVTPDQPIYRMVFIMDNGMRVVYDEHVVPKGRHFCTYADIDISSLVVRSIDFKEM